MSRYLSLLALLAAGALSACATDAPPPPATATATPVARPAPSGASSSFGLFLAGRTALDEGHASDAADLLSRAADAEGGLPLLRQHAFSAALMAGDIPKAASLAPDGEDADPAARRLGILVRGDEALAAGRYKEAVVLLTSDQISYPHKSAAVLLARWAQAGAGDKAALTTLQINGDGAAQFFSNLSQAILYEKAGQLGPAEAAFKGLQTVGDPGSVVSIAYGAFLERRSRWTEAAAIYDAAIARSPTDTALRASRARAMSHKHAPPMVTTTQGAALTLVAYSGVLVNEHQSELALAYLRLSLRLDPVQDDAWMMVGDLLSQQDDPENAQVAYAKVRPVSGRYIAARGRLAWSYENNGDTATALRLARETVVRSPDSTQAAVTLADILRASDRFEDSAKVLDSLIAAQGERPEWRLLYMRAIAYDGADQWPKAEQDLIAALKLRPDEPQLLNFLGFNWVDRGQHLEEAVAMLKRAVDANPQSASMLDSLGWGYYRLGDFKNAVEKLEVAATLEPANASVNNHLGDAYWRAGRKLEAQFQWRRVLSLNPDAAMRNDADVKLKSDLGPDAPRGPAATTGS